MTNTFRTLDSIKMDFLPRENRIIAGLADGILIGESFKSGGSLITAELGFSMNKEIFAIPGFINYLLKGVTI